MKRLLILLMLLVVSFALAEGELSLQAPEKIIGFSENAITVQAPFPGTLTVRVQDERNLWRTMTAEVPAGVFVLPWDGLAENQERLTLGKYTLSAELVSADGMRATAEITIQVNRNNQAILFALPSSEILWLREASAWRAEVRVVRDGRVVMEIFRADSMEEPVEVHRKECKAGRTNLLTWDGRIGGKLAEPGAYVLRLYAQDNPAFAKTFALTVAAGTAPVHALQLTQQFLPERGMTDAEIWSVMMQPVAVTKVAERDHLDIMSEPGGGARLGEVHGQSQALSILEIRQDGYVRVGAWIHEDGSYVEGYVPENRLKMVTPHTRYGLLLDKQTQRLTVYEYGKPIGTMPVSTGLAAKNRLIRETPAGAYVTLSQTVAFESEGYTYRYVIPYDGGNLMHQIGFEAGQGSFDFSDQEPLLGMKASHGCIRLPQQPCDGLNAYWMWSNIPAGTKLLILDDQEQREREALLVTGQVTDVNPVEPPPLAENETELVLTLGGDVVLGTREQWWRSEISLPAYMTAYGPDYFFSGLRQIFAGDDMTFVNLECVLKADGSGEDKSKEWRFRGLPDYAQALTAGSIEQVNIANNHFIDYGLAGREETLAALEAEGIPFSGFGYTYIWEHRGHKIGFAGCRETTYKSEPDAIYRDIASLRREGCDVIIYSCHWGTEYRSAHNDLQAEMAQAAMAAGADIVVGTHPHCVQGMDTVGDTLVFWSLGNLMFGGTHGNEMKTYDAALAQLRLRFDDSGYKGCTVDLIPILTSGTTYFGINDFRPVPAVGEDAARILDQIQADTPFSIEEPVYFSIQ